MLPGLGIQASTIMPLSPVLPWRSLLAGFTGEGMPSVDPACTVFVCMRVSLTNVPDQR